MSTTGSGRSCRWDGMTHKRTQILGQHMLTDSETIDYEVALARPDGERVLEIGGGTGNLTAAILDKAKQVTTIEIDIDMIYELKQRFKGKRKLKIVEADFLDVPANEYKADIIMGNIPYSASSPILFRLREWKFERAVLCVQKEFAERMVARPATDDYSRLSVMSQIYFNPVFLKAVSKSCFDPVPKVDSAIILLFPNNEKINPERDRLITNLFVHKRRTLAAALKSREFTDDEKKRVLDRAGSLGLAEKRIFQLSVEEIISLVKH